ncbi:hypothetical protein EON80_22575 [bacterium]|nr:MAG: hypothetical protein EON80_22575 [bacterium]
MANVNDISASATPLEEKSSVDFPVTNAAEPEPDTAPLTAVSERCEKRCIGFLADFTYSEYTARLFAGILEEAEAHDIIVQRFRLSGSRANDETLRRCLANDLTGLIIHDPDFRIPTDHLSESLTSRALPYLLLDVRGVV